MVTLRKMEQYSKISEYIRQKNEDHRVKKTLYMRNKFHDNSNSDKKLIKRNSNLGIDTSNNLKHVYHRKIPHTQRKNVDYIGALLQFEEDFSKGLMEQEYESLL